jgi:GNAT superfamily N-acetyltransferase
LARRGGQCYALTLMVNSSDTNRARAQIRPARPGDASAIAAMANALNLHVGKAPDVFTAEIVLRDAFGPDPAMSVLLAEREGEVVGYAMFVPSYNSDVAARSVALVDLFVVERARGQGLGTALMAAVAAETVRCGARCLEWAVLSADRRARAFYASIGAKDDDARLLVLHDDALEVLAAKGASAKNLLQ